MTAGGTSRGQPHSKVQWSRSRNRSRKRWVAFPRSTRMRNAPRCLHMSRPLERLVDLLVDVCLLLRCVLRTVPRFVEVSSRGPRVEGRVDRILPVRRIAVLVRIFWIALGWAEAAVSLAARFHRANHATENGQFRHKRSLWPGAVRPGGARFFTPSLPSARRPTGRSDGSLGVRRG